MADGTLLGSYFYHDIIPWDDDMDIMVDYHDYFRLKKIFHNTSIWSKYNLCGYADSFNEYEFGLLNKVYPDFDEIKTIKGEKLVTSNRTRFHKLRIFSSQAKKSEKYPWRWPFIDMTFFKYNSTRFWSYDVIQYFMPIDYFFPFHLRLFMGRWLPAPHRTGLFLKRKLGKLGKFVCQSGPLDHKNEVTVSRRERVSVPCHFLDKVYVKIIRSKLENGYTNETAIIADKILYSAAIEEDFDDVKLFRNYK